jgi:hypothetical protein
MLTLACYEPAGAALELSGDDLTRHIIAFGSTGSGKTTGVINPLLQQVIRWKATDPDSRVGLLVLDPKGDDSSHRVEAYARAAGRERDLVTLSAESSAWYDLLGGLEHIDLVEKYARRLLSGTRDMGQENAYWTETRNGLVETALILLLANGAPVHFADAISFMQAWWFSSDTTVLEPKLAFVRSVLADSSLTSETRRRLELALLEVTNWSNLDGKTKEIHKSCLSNALRPLLSCAAGNLFKPKQVPFLAKSVLEGKILVVSLDAISHPALARLLFRVIRRDFYSAVQSRPLAPYGEGRLCGLIADELPLSVMLDDVEALSVIRAKGGFVVAASQSIAGLDEVLGSRGRDALLANFNSVFFLASRETALDAYAFLTLGTQRQRLRSARTGEGGDLQIEGQPKVLVQEPVCPLGTLARLRQHQAFAKLADGTVTESPVWLQPSYFNTTATRRVAIRDDLADAVSRLRTAEVHDPRPPAASSSFMIHMHREGHRLFLTPNIVAAAWEICVPAASRNKLVISARTVGIRGLENLPSSWLAGILGWLAKQPQLAKAVDEVAVRSGALWLCLNIPTYWITADCGNLPEALNLAIYPSLWRPLKPADLMQLRIERPDLREELDSLPQAMELR